jgi:hypothetical protein
MIMMKLYPLTVQVEVVEEVVILCWIISHKGKHRLVKEVVFVVMVIVEGNTSTSTTTATTYLI